MAGTWLRRCRKQNDPTAIKVHNPLWSHRFAALAAIEKHQRVRTENMGNGPSNIRTNRRRHATAVG